MWGRERGLLPCVGEGKGLLFSVRGEERAGKVSRLSERLHLLRLIRYSFLLRSFGSTWKRFAVDGCFVGAFGVANFQRFESNFLGLVKFVRFLS